MAFKAGLLRAQLKKEGRTQRFLSELTGKNERTVSRWLSGVNAPKPKDLEKIADGLNCHPKDFDPTYADEGEGVPVSVRVSASSRNALELLRLKYGVSHTQVVEIAPVLFSLVAARALDIPAEDLELEQEAARRGYGTTLFTKSAEIASGFELDRRAAEAGKLYGQSNFDPYHAAPRNLFFEDIRRMCGEVRLLAGAELGAGFDPGEAVSSTGMLLERDLAAILTDDDPELIAAIADGKVRLGPDLRARLEDGPGAVAKALRRELEVAKAARRQEIEELRAASLTKLDAWRTFYSGRYPDLASEYDRLVAQYCHGEGWAPDYMGEEYRDKLKASPDRERRFINEDALPDHEKGAQGPIRLSHGHPVVIRLKELEAHRRKVRSAFEEASR